ncbi:MAG: fumarylacetoacetate hydrolase family protein [Deltaproteobacteria bacterium]|nr:MAG: fumarylacetoacetate hydrolase family protein [Deltaproteobacteria bacterium]
MAGSVRLAAAVACGLLSLAARVAAAPDPAGCVDAQSLPRVARILAEPAGAPTWVRVVSHEDGLPTAVSPLADGSLPIRAALDRAVAEPGADVPVWRLDDEARRDRVCSPVPLRQADLDAERRVVVAAGLNYAAHAEEAGGGDVFVFPKPVAPGAPYGRVAAPAGVVLLDYEVELGFVLLEDVDLTALPSRTALLARSAFFVANDVTDREPIIVHKAFSGPGTGFVDAKGQPGFLPLGPWLVRGTELFAALDACAADGLGLRLEVDEGEGFEVRQDASTAAMILDPLAFLARIGDEVSRDGARTPMPLRRTDPWRYYPMAVAGDGGRLRLPAGSIVLTGTPEGVALRAPSPLGVVARGLVRLRSPFEQARQEELARAAGGEPGGYLEPGDRVRARIDGLGAQLFEIAAPGSSPAADPCESTTEASHR